MSICARNFTVGVFTRTHEEIIDGHVRQRCRITGTIGHHLDNLLISRNIRWVSNRYYLSLKSSQLINKLIKYISFFRNFLFFPIYYFEDPINEDKRNRSAIYLMKKEILDFYSRPYG